MEIRRSMAAFCSAVLLLSVPCVAGATESGPTPNDDAMSTTARDLFLRGADAWKHGRWDQCRASLLAAWSIKPVRQIAGNLAACEMKLGKHRDAAEHLAFLLRPGAVGERPELSAEHRKLLAEATAKIGAVRLEADPGATVLVDGKTVGQAPLADAIYLEPGEHVVEARPEHGPALRVAVTAAAGESKEVTLRAPAPEPRPNGKPVAPPAPPPATATVEARSWVPGIVLGAASVVALGVGVGTTIASNNASEDAHAQRETLARMGGQCAKPTGAFVQACADLSHAGSETGTFGHVALGSYIASGVLAAAATTYLLWPRRAGDTSRSVRVTPSARAGGGELVVSGVW